MPSEHAKNISVTDFSVKEKIGHRLTPKEVGARIKALRESLMLDQKGLAEWIGAKQNTVSEWEKGEYKPSAMALIALGNMARVDRGWWFEQAGPEYAARRRRPYAQQNYMDAERVLHDLSESDPVTSAYEKELGGVELIGRPVPASSLDQELLAFAIETVRVNLKNRKVKLRNDEEYAQAVAIFYDLCHETRTRNPAMLEPVLRRLKHSG
jgi:DNA-binding transcriptional regulator YiaG